MTTQQIGPCAIQHPTAAGGMAGVRAARDTADRRPVALKVWWAMSGNHWEL